MKASEELNSQVRKVSGDTIILMFSAEEIGFKSISGENMRMQDWDICVDCSPV